MKKPINIILTVVIVSVVTWSGCKKSSTDPSPVTTGTLSMGAAYTKNVVSGGALMKTEGVTSPAAVDSIKITRARFVLRDIKFKTVEEDSMNFKSSPMVLELDLTGTMQSVGVSNVRFATYRRIEFDVHRVEAKDLTGLSQADSAKFADFLAGEKYSVIIDGTVYKTGQSGQAFTYRSKIDARQKVDLTPNLVVTEASPTVNATIMISSANWFTGTGALVDPTDTNSEGIINENLKNSIKVFKDNDKDGSKDGG